MAAGIRYLSRSICIERNWLFFFRMYNVCMNLCVNVLYTCTLRTSMYVLERFLCHAVFYQMHFSYTLLALFTCTKFDQKKKGSSPIISSRLASKYLYTLFVYTYAHTSFRRSLPGVHINIFVNFHLS